MDSQTYLEESATTASAEFHDEIVDGAMLEQTLKQAIATGELVDVAKKSLYYGRAVPGDSALNEHKGTTAAIDMKAVDKDVLHAALGIYTEAAEMLEGILKAMQGEPFDTVNAFEELGDAEWYMAMFYRALNKTPQEAKSVNIEKLRKRYPEKFKSHHANERDIAAERAILETGMSGE